MTRLTNHRPLMRASVLATVVAAVGFASALPARAADEVHSRPAAQRRQGAGQLAPSSQELLGDPVFQS